MILLDKDLLSTAREPESVPLRPGGKLRDELSFPIPISISDNQIAFIILAKTEQRREEIKVTSLPS